MPVCSFPFFNWLSHTLYQVTCNVLRLSLSQCLFVLVAEDLKTSPKCVTPAFVNEHKLPFRLIVLWKLGEICTSALDWKISFSLKKFSFFLKISSFSFKSPVFKCFRFCLLCGLLLMQMVLKVNFESKKTNSFLKLEKGFLGLVA